MADTYYSIDSGFYDSVNKDRLYSADDMNRPYKSILTEGIFQKDDGFAVTAAGGMLIRVAAGIALLGERWIDADEVENIPVPENTSLYNRTDSVILQINNKTEVRAGRIVYRTGTPGSGNAPDLITGDDDIAEVRLANIFVASNAAAITSANITDRRGSTDCPYVKFIVGNEQIVASVEDVLEAHPEWTTTIQNGAVTTAKIALMAVTDAKIADNAVIARTIANGNVTKAKLAQAVRDQIDGNTSDITDLKADLNSLGLSVVDGCLCATYTE